MSPNRFGRLAAGRGGDPVPDHGIMGSFPAPLAQIRPPAQTRIGKAPTPFDDNRFRDPQRFLDLIVPLALRGQQDNPCTQDITLRRCGGPDNAI